MKTGYCSRCLCGMRSSRASAGNHNGRVDGLLAHEVSQPIAAAVVINNEVIR